MPASSDPPTNPALAPCAACVDDQGKPTGDMLVQLPSGTWVRRACESCGGRRTVARMVIAERRSEADGAFVQSDRPTQLPPFDVATFARESDAALRAVSQDTAPDHAGSIPIVDEVMNLDGAHEAIGAGTIPVLAMPREDVPRLGLAADVMTLVTLVDGVSSIETLSSRAKVTTEEGATLLLELAVRGVVGFR